MTQATDIDKALSSCPYAGKSDTRRTIEPLHRWAWTAWLPENEFVTKSYRAYTRLNPRYSAINNIMQAKL